MRDGLKHGERATTLGGERPEGRLAAVERLLEPPRALVVIEQQPPSLLQRGPDHSPMHERVLAHIDHRHVEPERPGPTQQPPHREQAGVAALVGTQAVGDELDVGDELVRRFVGICGIVVGGLQARPDEPQKRAIRHLPVAQRQRGGRFREVAGVQGRAPIELLGHRDALRALAQLSGELLALAIVQIQHERALPGERLA